MSTASRAGTSLVELLISLVLLELLGMATLHTVLQTQRVARHTAATGATDVARLHAVRTAAAAPACRHAATPTAVPLSLPAAPSRPAITMLLRCGR